MLPPLLSDTLSLLERAWPVLAFGGALLLPGVRARLRGWLRDTPAEHAAAHCAAWDAEPEKLDAALVRAHARVMPRLRPHIDAEYAAVMERREATERGLAGAVAGLREELAKRDAAQAKPLSELAQSVRDLTHEVKSLAETVGDLRGDHRDLAKVVGDTREELAAYAGENNRRRGRPGRRADDVPR